MTEDRPTAVDVEGGTRAEMRERLEGHFRNNTSLLKRLLLVWALVSYGGAIVSKLLNQVSIAGFPLGYYVSSQLAVLTFIILAFLYAARMDVIDHRYGVDE